MNTHSLPPQPFFRTPEQRTALAREQFFEESLRPSGLVSETVIQSWDRCRQLGHRAEKIPALDPVGRSALSAALARNEDLIQAARLELDQLQASLSGTHCRVLLTDERGVIVHLSQNTHEANQSVLDKASRLGVNLAEGRLGTTAPGIVVHTGQASHVQGGEHFYDLFRELRCAAAPIRDIHGHLAGVLDLTTEARDFGFDAAAVVGMFATTIGNRLLVAQSRELLVLHFQTAPSLLNTPMEGLLGVDTHGKVIWINQIGHSLLGAQQQAALLHVNDVLGMGLNALMGLCGDSHPRLLQLPSGLGIWVKASLQGGHEGRARPPRHPSSAVSPPPLGPAQPTAPTSEARAPETETLPDAVPHSEASLAQAQQRLIGATLQAHHGNVAKTARLLGVSRGLVYRHMRKAQADEPPPDH
jgi:sigma-54 dependent transcriptional regulator, acetoin dehydrogenase operon transcriptional activator AcoR